METVGQTSQTRHAEDQKWFRQVLGQYPSGVCVVTGQAPGREPTGMVVGSFTSVSLDPPMVAFFPAVTSDTWPLIAEAGSFCVNILGADQEALCRRFAAKGVDRFEGQGNRPAPSGAPILDDALAWLDCDLELVQPAGDHYIVLGRVRDLQLERPRLPLLFFQGGYGRFEPLSMTTADADGLFGRQLRHFDIIRPEVERLAARPLGCAVTGRSGNHIVVLSKSDPADERTDPTGGTLVGQQLPFRPPAASVFQAWGTTEETERWLSPLVDATRRSSLEGLARIRERGYSVGLINDAQREFASTLDQLSVEPATIAPEGLYDLVDGLVYDPPHLDEDTLRQVRLVSAPVFDNVGAVTVAISGFGFPHEPAAARETIDAVLDAAATSTRLIGGRPPQP